MMESAINDGEALKDVANKTSHDADTEGITGFMYGAAVSILSQCWIHGEELRKWHNGEYNYTGNGVVNPAILTPRSADPSYGKSGKGGKPLRVLVACEESQEVCKAFRALGHEAYSCDIEPCSGGHPEWHLQVDATELLKMPWDMIIAFPPCTYMTNAGAVRMRVNGEIVPERYEKAMQAKDFFMKFYEANCPKIAIENPTPMKIVGLPPYNQAIQPYMLFGHPYSKRTCLWLKGLPPLMATDILMEHEPYVNGGCKDAHGNYRRIQGRKERDPKTRSKTFPGIAKAMAEQWGGET